MRKTFKGKGFAGAVVVTVLVAGLMLLITGVLLAGWFGEGSDLLCTVVILLCALFYLAIAAGVIVCLYQRWKEIQGGEEDEAKKY